MSDRPNGAASAAPAAPSLPAPREHTEREVAGVLAGLLDKEEASEPRERPRPEPPPQRDEPEEPDDTESEPPEEGDDDVAADDSPPSDDEPDDEGEATERSRVDPPAGWNAEDRKAWNSLPPAVQETIRRRDTEMSARLTRGTQEQAERERAWTTQLEVANADRNQYVQNLQVFQQVLLPEAQALANVDMARLSTENPAEYVKLLHAEKAMRDRFGWIQSEVQRIQQIQQHEHAQRRAEAQKLGHQRLVEAMPEFADPAEAHRLGTELGAYLRKKGFADNEIASVTDNRAIQLAMVAMRAESQASAAQRADSKRTPRPAPQVQRPGSSRRSSDGDSQKHRMTQLATRFHQTRSIKDAASIVASWLPK